MNDLQSIQAVYADPQVDGMDDLYQAIASKMSPHQNFAQAYALSLIHI